MGKLIGMSNIVNPMATHVMELTVNDQMQVNLQCSLPPDQAIKILQATISDIMFSYINSRIESISNGPTLQ